MSKLVGKDPERRLPAADNRVVELPFPEGIYAFQPRSIRGPADGPMDGSGQRGVWRGAVDPPAAGPSDIEVEAIRQQALQEGFSQGEQAGYQRASEQMRDAVAAWGRTVLELATLKPELRSQAQHELVDLAFAIARRILRRQLLLDPGSVTSVVRACLHEYERVEMRRIAVNPQDLELVADYFRQNPIQGLEIAGDPKISRGGAVFETAQGRLDATLETQLAEIERGLADR